MYSEIDSGHTSPIRCEARDGPGCPVMGGGCTHFMRNPSPSAPTMPVGGGLEQLDAGNFLSNLVFRHFIVPIVQ